MTRPFDEFPSTVGSGRTRTMDARRTWNPPVRDLVPRLILSPVFGAAIPNLAGLIEHSAHTIPSLIASYAYFTLVAFLIWEGNRRLHFRFRANTDWFQRPSKRIAVILGALGLYTVPLSLAMLWLWGTITADPAFDPARLGVAVLIVVICTTIVTHAYETLYLLRGWESDRLRNEVLRRERLEAELDALKMQVDPHVLFNQLHTLSQLVETGRPSAAAYVQALADSYRYLLKTRRSRAVSLSEELSLLDRFAALAEIRMPGALRLNVDVPPDRAAELYLPPVTLPELLDNAAKHNRASPDQPLVVDVRLSGERLIVSNALRPGAPKAPSNAVGLANLAERVRLTTGAPMMWEAREGRFSVSIPLVSGNPPQEGSDGC